VPENQYKIEGYDFTMSWNPGGLTKAGFDFMGWNTASDGSGTN